MMNTVMLRATLTHVVQLFSSSRRYGDVLQNVGKVRGYNNIIIQFTKH